jgi:lysophospholipase L1-like esterase
MTSAGSGRTARTLRILRLPSLALAALLLAGCAARTVEAAEPRSASASTSSARTPLRLVALGDSIPMGSQDDCPGCTGFVRRYAGAAQQALGRPVAVTNLSQHTGLTLPQLLDELDTFRSAITGADLVVVGIAHNTIELNADRPCGAALVDDHPDWSAMTPACAAASAKRARAQYDRLFTRIAGWRRGSRTVLRTITRYDDWNGAAGSPLTPAQAKTVRLFIDRWNVVLRSSAQAHGFRVADLHHAFNGAAGRAPSGDLLAADSTHPSDRGDAVIAAALVRLGFAPLQR